MCTRTFYHRHYVIVSASAVTAYSSPLLHGQHFSKCVVAF